ncbi:MAG: HNH endonuclease, partial [Myxococcota bacterium]|nr:HNH endonuclease [Myxococcota bacterium]
MATPAIEAVLLEDALLTTGQQLEMICRKYATVQRHGKEVGPLDERERRHVRRRDLEDGMVRIEATLHPEEAAVVWAALERIAAEKCREPQPAEPAAAVVSGISEGSEVVEVVEVVAATAQHAESKQLVGDDVPAGTFGDRRLGVPAGTFGDQRIGVPAGTSCDPKLDIPAGTSDARESRKTSAFDRAGALVAMAQAVIRGEHKDRSPYQLVVSVAARTLQRDADPDSASVACCADGTCISADTARRLGCDGSVVEFVEDARGTAISVGRKTRTIPGSMKRALLRRDRTCRFPGCRTRVFLEGHHIEHWADGGETKLSNLISCCDFHHRFVHEYGYR